MEQSGAVSFGCVNRGTQLISPESITVLRWRNAVLLQRLYRDGAAKHIYI